MIVILNGLLIICLIMIIKAFISKKIALNIKEKIYEQEIIENKKCFLKNHYIKSVLYCLIIGLMSFIVGNTIIKSLFFAIMTYLLIIWYERLKNKTREKQVLQDLLNVAECLRVQLSSGISLSISLRNIPVLCKNKEFSGELTNLYLEYELSKFTVSTSAKELETRFNYPEIKMFISALKQQTQHTSALEAFDNLIEVLKEKYIEYMEDNTRVKSLIMVLGVCIVVFNLALMSVYPMILEANEAISVMLN